MITRKDILSALGGEQDDQEDRLVVGLLVGLGLGALVGGAIALLVAPRSGAEVRQMIGEKVGGLREKVEKEIH